MLYKSLEFLSRYYTENVKTVGPGPTNIRPDRQIELVGPADIVQWFYAGPIKNRSDRQNIGLVGPVDRQKIDGFHILWTCTIKDKNELILSENPINTSIQHR